MAAIPNKNILDGSKVPATKVSEMKTALGGLYDYLVGILGTTGVKADARTALEVQPTTSPVFQTSLSLQNATSPLGYGAGSGATYTQATNKQTAVTVTKPSGVITMHNQSLAANDKATFLIAYTGATNNDIALVGLRGGITNEKNYNLNARATASGVQVIVWKTSTGALAENIEIKYELFRGSAT